MNSQFNFKPAGVPGIPDISPVLHYRPDAYIGIVSPEPNKFHQERYNMIPTKHHSTSGMAIPRKL